VEFTILASKVPVLPWALEYADSGLIPAGSHANRRFCDKHLEVDAAVPQNLADLLSDAQTSGGLLVALPQAQTDLYLERLHDSGLTSAAAIGRIGSAGVGKIHVVS
jgi:selenide,water dikinase